MIYEIYDLTSLLLGLDPVEDCGTVALVTELENWWQSLYFCIYICLRNRIIMSFNPKKCIVLSLNPCTGPQRNNSNTISNIILSNDTYGFYTSRYTSVVLKHFNTLNRFNIHCKLNH